MNAPPPFSAIIPPFRGTHDLTTSPRPNDPVSIFPFFDDRAIAVLRGEDLADMTFREAAKAWIESRKTNMRGRTPKFNQQVINNLNKFLGDIRVRNMEVGHLEAFQRARLRNSITVGETTYSPWKKLAGPSCINHEVSVVQQIMKRAKVWDRIGSQYRRLPDPAFKKKKVLEEDEKLHLQKVATSNAAWEWVYWVLQITANTTASGVELRNLQFQDVQMDAIPPRMFVNGDTAKNRHRGRLIPLNNEAKVYIELCMDRARKAGSHRPSDYIFPYRKGKGDTSWVPTRPSSGSWLKKPFDAMREAADLPWLTPHCFRHQAITELLENGTPEETVRSIAGHVSEEMMRHYSHTRLHVKERAVAGLSRGQQKHPGAVTQLLCHRPTLRGRRRFQMRRMKMSPSL